MVDGQKYRSKREAKRHQELLLLERAGKISGLRREVPFELSPGVKWSNRRASPPLRYFADFTYSKERSLVVEDCKGVRPYEYRIKRHLMMAIHGIEILET